MKLLNKAGSIFDRVISRLAVVAGVLVIFMLSAVLYEVVCRYFFGRAVLWTYEIIEFTMLFITFLATTWLLKKEGHVKIDLVLQRLKPKSQAVLNVTTSIICAIAFLIIVVFSAMTTWESAQLGYFTPTELKIPQHFVLFIIPVGSFLLFIQFLRRAYLNLGSITK